MSEKSLEEEASADADIAFGESKFRNGTWITEFDRWFTQFFALLIKNYRVLMVKKSYLIVFLLIPSAITLTFMLEFSGGAAAVPTVLPSVPVSGLGDCNAYFTEECIRVVYAPSNTETDNIMSTFSTANGLTMNSDVISFPHTNNATAYVAQNLGKVQFSVFFRNESLWETAYYTASTAAAPISKNMSYVIYYNSSAPEDPRSSTYGVNFPLLALQKSLEESYLKERNPQTFSSYDVNYGQFWSYGEAVSANSSINYNTSSSTLDSPCFQEYRPSAQIVGMLLPMVAAFGLLCMSVVSFQLVAEERQRKLFDYLRRLGLMDSAYWASWFITLQVCEYMNA